MSRLPLLLALFRFREAGKRPFRVVFFSLVFSVRSFSLQAFSFLFLYGYFTNGIKNRFFRPFLMDYPINIRIFILEIKVNGYYGKG